MCSECSFDWLQTRIQYHAWHHREQLVLVTAYAIRPRLHLCRRHMQCQCQCGGADYSQDSSESYGDTVSCRTSRHHVCHHRPQCTHSCQHTFLPMMQTSITLCGLKANEVLSTQNCRPNHWHCVVFQAIGTTSCPSFQGTTLLWLSCGFCFWLQSSIHSCLPIVGWYGSWQASLPVA